MSVAPVNLFEPLPLAPGKSGLHMKGLAYRGVCEYARTHIPEGLAAVTRCFNGESVRDFCAQPFMAASWYDVLPIQSLVAAVASLMGVPFEAFVREGARKQAGFDCATVYKHVISECEPGQAFINHTRIGLRYYDFLEAGAEMVAPQQARAWLSGIPQYLLPWFLPMQEGYSAEVLRVAGAHRPRLTFGPPKPIGTKGKLTVVRLELNAVWT